MDEKWSKQLTPKAKALFIKHNINSPQEAFVLVEELAEAFRGLGKVLVGAFQPVIRAFNDFLEAIPDDIKDEMELPFRVEEPADADSDLNSKPKGGGVSLVSSGDSANDGGPC